MSSYPAEKRSWLDSRAISVLRKKRERNCTTRDVLDRDYRKSLSASQRAIIFRRVRRLEKLERKDRIAFLELTLPISLANNLQDAVAADAAHHKLLEGAYD